MVKFMMESGKKALNMEVGYGGVPKAINILDNGIMVSFRGMGFMFG